MFIEPLGSKGVTCFFHLYLTHLQRILDATAVFAIEGSVKAFGQGHHAYPEAVQF